MARIYKSVGPSSNKAETGSTANKGTSGAKAPKEPEKKDTEDKK